MTIRIEIDRSKLTWRYHWKLKICYWLLDRLERWK